MSPVVNSSNEFRTRPQHEVNGIDLVLGARTKFEVNGIDFVSD